MVSSINGNGRPTGKEMKRVAIIGADFAPSSLPPALRIRYFAQHLPEFGWQPIVLTTEPKYYEWQIDPENECLLPDTVKVIRTPAWPVKVTRKLGIGDVGARSMWYHWRALVRLCRQQKVDLLFIPVPPYFPMMLARLAYHRLGIPCVVDYIDPWVSDHLKSLPKEQVRGKLALFDKLSRILEPLSLKHVRHIVGVSKGTTDGVIVRYTWLSEDDTTEIPYGGEPGDFEYLRKNPRRNSIFNPHDGLLHISYVGAYPKGMEGTMRAVFAALKLGLERNPELFRRLRFHFIGTTYDPRANDVYQLRPIAREMGIEELIDEQPARVPYLDALQLLLDSHALAVLGSDAPHYTASKIFPYILARKPLLTVFHEASSVVDILNETQAGQAVTYNEQSPPGEKIEEIFRQLENILKLPADYQPPTRWEAFEPYTTRAMTARLVQAFEKSLNNR